MIRWSYLFPRILMLGLIGLAVWIGRDPLIRRVMIRTGEDAIGAKVNFAQVRTSISKGKIYLQDIRIADPQHPMLNMVQAEMAYLKLDPRHLLHREIVIESGKTSKLQFGAPRTDSGALGRSVIVGKKYQPFEDNQVTQNFDDLSQSWLDRFQTNLVFGVGEDFESVKLAQEFKARWPAQLEASKQQILAVQNRINELTQEIQSTDNANPLRSGRIHDALTEIQALHDRITQLRRDLGELKQQALADRDALLASKQNDAKKIGRLVRGTQFDAQTISQLLLSESQSRNVTEIVNWFRWFRATIPNPEEDFCPVPKRGVDIALNGVKQTPRFLIKSLDIDGGGRLAGQHLNFVGVATNLTTQPQLHDEPAGFHLRAQGRQHLIVDCIIDRRTDSWVDSFNVQCPDLNVDSQVLGNRESIAVSMGPSRLQGEIALTIVGDKLEGELVFRHSEVLMHVDYVHEFAGGKDAALSLNQDLASVDRFQTYVKISGNLNDPKFELRSDLGNKFAAALNHVLSNRIEKQILANQTRLDQVFEAQLSELDRTVLAKLDELAGMLDGDAKIISDLKQLAPTTEPRSKIR